MVFRLVFEGNSNGPNNAFFTSILATVPCCQRETSWSMLAFCRSMSTGIRKNWVSGLKSFLCMKHLTTFYVYSS